MGGVDVRGAAPGTLGTDTLRPGMLIEHVHGVLLTGGSAFGLAAASGMMRYLEEHEVGYQLGLRAGTDRGRGGDLRPAKRRPPRSPRCAGGL